ncbi:MAG: site-specific integrase [Candidatus Margulisbacteria bacterium]|nr:site-specific integrase [Candidatus Margulisiibacteriota bacterium]
MVLEKTLKDYAENLFVSDGYWRAKRKKKGRDICDEVLRRNRSVVKNYIIPLFGSLSLENITPKIIDQKLIDATSLNGNDLAGTTRNGILGCLSTIFNYLVEEDIVSDNPVKKVFRFSSKPANQRGILSHDEMQKLFPQNRADLLEIWGSQKYICAFLILKDTGLRPGELRALQWKDWRLDLRFFPITKAIESGKRAQLKGTKTGMSKPAIVTEFTAGEIEHLKELSSPALESFIFTQKNNIPIDGCVLSRHFRDGLKRAGIDKSEISPYWLRHTFNTRMLETMPDSIVRKLMGHATPNMTQYYRHADEISLANEAQKIHEYLADPYEYRGWQDSNFKFFSKNV